MATATRWTDTEWTEEDFRDLETLERLLNEVTLLSSGGHVIERMQRCIEMAESLRRKPLGEGPAFCYRLQLKAAGRETP